MTTLRGTMGFLDTGANTADVTWLCVVTSDENKAPEVRVQRFAKGKPDTRGGKLTLKENGEKGGNATGDKGEVQLVAKATALTQGALFVWSFNLSARAGGAEVSYVFSARVGSGDFTELSRVNATSLTRPDLNTTAPVTKTLKEAPVPRLSVGINQSLPVVAKAPYQGFSPGSGDAGKAGAGGAAELRALLYRLFVILDADGTLDPMWDDQSLTRTTESLSPQKFQADKVRVAEELWARQVTEMLSFAPYGGPGASYGGGCTDLELITAGIDKDAKDPRYGIFYACQHLANFGVMSRGLQTLPASGNQMNAGTQCVITVMSMGGSWIDSTSPPKPLAKPTSDPGVLGSGSKEFDLTPVLTQTFTDKGSTVKYQPGSVHLFSNRAARKDDPKGYEAANKKLTAGEFQPKKTVCAHVSVVKGSKGATRPRELCLSVEGKEGTHNAADLIVSSTGGKFLADNTAGPEIPHLGFSLRVRPGRVQMFDTGGFAVQGRGAGVSVMGASTGFHSGIFDDPLTRTLKGGHPYRGTGIFPAVDDAAADKMRTHVFDVLRKARPIGVAKFVLLRRAVAGENKPVASRIIMATPVLAMWGKGTAFSNYAISRYVWSLRGLPCAADVEAVWLIWAPMASYGGSLLRASRSDTALGLATKASGFPAAATGDKDRRLHDFLNSNLNHAVDVVSQSDGTVKLAGKGGKTNPHPLHMAIQRAEVRLDQRVGPAITGAPSYFDG